MNIDNCAENVSEFIASARPKILGPHETAYGYGWSPTISYWIGERRVHLYEDLNDENERFTIEVANTSSVARCYTNDLSAIEDIMTKFLCKNIAVESLAEYNWIYDGHFQDSNIPCPPNSNTPANFAGKVGGHVEITNTTSRPTLKKRPWWKLWQQEQP